MPFGLKPKCSKCKTTASTMWRKTEKDEVICNTCSNNSSDGNENPFNLRKSTIARSTKTRSSKPKGKSRRSLFFKKMCNKAPTSDSTVVTMQCVFYKNVFYQIGDIVSIKNERNEVYYAQIRGLMQDHNCEKSAVITWLLPTLSTPKDRFDPTSYILGEKDDIPRKLDCFKFVSHAPSDYYKPLAAPYHVNSEKFECGFIWGRIGPQIPFSLTKEEAFQHS
ncbi:GATA zinc finger domain-containing protein 1 [Caerostris darwini]|uniref:GATA zinc finger domain-containing protein 1 n=1 Tax=Caerostris darwini TaxID=1538125 RepID=A0AAV4MZA0_9ARAC|nr:GATA zinc finger domain-containing protein 1 [Caerostris darwini]